MRSLLERAVREFDPVAHLKNLESAGWVTMYDDHGHVLGGIRGRCGLCAIDCAGVQIGVDQIEMNPGSGFPPHTHEGDHILYIQGGNGIVHIGGQDRDVGPNDLIWVPAEAVHGVRVSDEATEPLVLLAFARPHRAPDAPDRMKTV